MKIKDEQIHYDLEINNTETMLIGTDRKEVLMKIQEDFARQYHKYGKLKEKEILTSNYNSKQAWERFQKVIIKKRF